MENHAAENPKKKKSKGDKKSKEMKSGLPRNGSSRSLLGDDEAVCSSGAESPMGATPSGKISDFTTVDIVNGNEGMVEDISNLGKPPPPKTNKRKKRGGEDIDDKRRMVDMLAAITDSYRAITSKLDVVTHGVSSSALYVKDNWRNVERGLIALLLIPAFVMSIVAVYRQQQTGYDFDLNEMATRHASPHFSHLPSGAHCTVRLAARRGMTRASLIRFVSACRQIYSTALKNFDAWNEALISQVRGGGGMHIHQGQWEGVSGREIMS